MTLLLPHKQQAQVLKKLSIIIAFIVGLSLPVVYGVVSYQSLTSSLFLKAKIKADAQKDVITALPDTWMYAENRIKGLLKREPILLVGELVELFDVDGNLVVATGENIKRWKLERSYPLEDIDHVVGKIVVSTSLSTFYKSVFFVSLIGFALGGLVFIILRLLPVKALQSISQELYDEKERAEATLNSINEAILVSDSEGRLLYFNSFAEKMFGEALIERQGEDFLDLLTFINKNTGNKIRSTLEKALYTKILTGCKGSTVFKVDDTTEIDVEELATPVFDENGVLTGAVLCLRDVTIERETLKRQSWEASHDILTKLVNRSEFERCTEEAIQNAQLSNEKYTVLYMDLDRFKVINDSCGHSAGDDLLKQVTRMMASYIRDTDVFARLGGDEFGVLLEDCDEEKGIEIAETLLEAVKGFQFFWKNKVYTIGLSIGVTVIGNECFTLSEVLGQADSACYWAKDQGRQRICVFRESDIDLAVRRSQTGWVSKINEALKDNRFILYHQQYLHLSGKDDTPLHLEILLRMLSKKGEIISPDQFIPAAERYNLIIDIDRWVIHQVMSDFHRLQKQHNHKKLIISINLSGASINSPKFLTYIKEKITEFNVDPEQLCFEVTETVAVKDIASAIEFITACKRLGVKFALDDFGTGTSSFGYLKQLPIDYLKIDGSFIKNIEYDQIDRAMVESINKIGHIMEKKTIAEYAENQAIINILDDIGVDYAQGYGVCRPKPLLLKDNIQT